MDSTPINYQTHFGNAELGFQAKETLTQFLSFAGRTLEQLVELGAQLTCIRHKCTETLNIKEGKKAFKEWLNSEEFGGSRYLAESAMRLSEWFNGLSHDLQQLVISKANHWSIAALKQLPSLTNDIVTQLIQTGQQTAASIQAVIKKPSKKPKINPLIDINDLEPGETLIFSPPERTGDEDLDNLIGCQVELIEILNPDSNRPTLQIRHLDEPDQILVCRPNEVRKSSPSSTNQLEAELAQLKEILAAQSDEIQQLKEERDYYSKQLKNIESQQQEQTKENQWKEERNRLLEENQELKEKLSQLEEKIDSNSEQLQPGNMTLEIDDKDLLIHELTEQLKAYQKLELPLTDEQLFVGARVKVITCDQGWAGYTGIVKERLNNNGWWLELDGIDSAVRQLYKAGQLTWNLQLPTFPTEQLKFTSYYVNQENSSNKVLASFRDS
ncbi:hypothetical protein [Gloeothece verrucosa]|uniref:Uncharacterized protein n=1 Tax=Gloeothece verrucosa (strain PCC 7822) TaxID=497965 RepID=E0UNJ5_GLOV7|nr:hypothetical protein [Gloeothece verrucosa]ADN18525.1 hypothetical protein Cyan7822_6880 [Gloeothece verrucosa PCC 7822]